MDELGCPEAVQQIRAHLFALQDTAYGDFSARLVPTVDRARVIGVRMPQIDALATALSGSETESMFLDALPHRYLEENHLHAAMLNGMRDDASLTKRMECFLPFLDNWASCDSLRPRALRHRPAHLSADIRRWLSSDHAYTVRFGIETLMQLYLDDAFSPSFPEQVAAVRMDDYYVKMMVAWYFATALAKQYDAVLPYFETPVLEPWTRRRAIQKAIESRRITPAQKEYLRGLRQR